MEQIDKNNVSADKQLKDNGYISFEGKPDGNPRILFVGNSITRHGVKEDIGWLNDFGMAASSKEKDYVHLVKEWALKKNPDTCICICQGSQWELGYAGKDWTFDRYRAARDFKADIIVFRLIENVSRENFDHGLFRKSVVDFLSYLNPDGNAEIIMTTGFWRHPGDEDLISIAEENNYPLADLGVLGDNDEMKAIGLFEHTGVANHPGDKGMSAIAEAIEKLINNI